MLTAVLTKQEAQPVQRPETLQERMQRFHENEQERCEDELGRQENYIILPGEIPWREIYDRKERQKACHRQGRRVLLSLRSEQERHVDGLSIGPLDWEKKYIINPSETPWWEIHDRKERYKACVRQWMRMWVKLHPGAAAEAKRQSRKNHPEYRAEVYRRSYKTPKGKASYAKQVAMRRALSTNPALYAARVLQLHTNKEPCAECGALYSETHQIDHILALCLGGTDVWENYRPLCIKCHPKKTAEDRRKLHSIIGR